MCPYHLTRKESENIKGICPCRHTVSFPITTACRALTLHVLKLFNTPAVLNPDVISLQLYTPKVVGVKFKYYKSVIYI
jgi:hypothetical protein